MKVLYSKKNGITNKLSGVNLPVDADKINYDNTDSELQSTNVQDAIDEVVDTLDDKVDKVTGKGLSTNDYDNTDKAKVGKIDTTTTAVTGNPISITGLKSNQLAKDPIITFEPIQAGSGDPSPSNVRAISGYDKIEVLSCGKNLFDKNAQNTSNGFVDEFCLIADGTLVNQGNLVCVSEYIPLKPNTGYFLNGVLGGNYSICFYKSNKDFVSGIAYNDVGYVSFETTSEMQLCRITVWKAVENSIQLEEGTSATTYEPYNKTTDLSLQLGQTIYGGTLDVEKGILTVDRGYVMLDGSSDENWVQYADKPVYYCSIGGTPEFASSPKHVISDKFKYVYAVWDNYTNPWCFSDHPQLENIYYSVDSSVIHDETEMRNWLANNPVTVIRYLATPFTIQLTPHEIGLLKDYAYVSTNGTSISFDYHNGEMASLGDVAQLGQTVNELGKVTDISNQVTWDTTYLNIDTSRSSVIRTGNVVQIVVWGTWKGAYQNYTNVDLITNLPKTKAYLNPYLAPCIPNMYSGDTRSNTYCEVFGTTFRIIIEEAITVQDKLFIGTFIYICE